MPGDNTKGGKLNFDHFLGSVMGLYMEERKRRDQEVRETFASTLDADGSGELSKAEFILAVKALVNDRFDGSKLEILWREVRCGACTALAPAFILLHPHTAEIDTGPPAQPRRCRPKSTRPMIRGSRNRKSRRFPLIRGFCCVIVTQYTQRQATTTTTLSTTKAACRPPQWRVQTSTRRSAPNLVRSRTHVRSPNFLFNRKQTRARPDSPCHADAIKSKVRFCTEREEDKWAQIKLSLKWALEVAELKDSKRGGA